MGPRCFVRQAADDVEIKTGAKRSSKIVPNIAKRKDRGDRMKPVSVYRPTSVEEAIQILSLHADSELPRPGLIRVRRESREVERLPGAVDGADGRRRGVALHLRGRIHQFQRPIRATSAGTTRLRTSSRCGRSLPSPAGPRSSRRREAPSRWPRSVVGLPRASRARSYR